MKYCPTCRTEYADDSLQFCLQDGTPLAGVSNQNASPDYEAESETLVVPKKVEPIRFEPPSSYQTDLSKNQANWGQSQPVIVEREPKKSNTTAIVLLSILGTIALLGLGGLGAWLYFKNNKTAVAVNVNTAPPNRPANVNAANNQNANLATPSPSATATPKPTLDPQQAKAITGDVNNVIDEWKNATENLDLDTHLSQYADTIDYYRAGRVGIGTVRADKQRAYNSYDSIAIDVTNMKITPDASGNKAIAVFDKEWNFEGEQRNSSGKVQQQLTLNKINGRWVITGEKDLRVYYTDK
jgi:hypothetical protein